MKQIENIINASSEQVKKILLEEARKIKDFPKIMFMRKNDRITPTPGIVISYVRPSQTKDYVVIMLPNGLYNFGIAHHPIREIEEYPYLESKIEIPLDYLVYGSKAFCKMRKLSKI